MGGVGWIIEHRGPSVYAAEACAHAEKESITYAHTYALNGILARDFTRRRHAPATAIHIVILRLEEACRFGPIAIR
jgi:hypothetical protein